MQNNPLSPETIVKLIEAGKSLKGSSGDISWQWKTYTLNTTNPLLVVTEEDIAFIQFTYPEGQQLFNFLKKFYN
jgi:hypothetical protein